MGLRTFLLLIIIPFMLSVPCCTSAGRDKTEKNISTKTVLSDPVVTEESNISAREAYKTALQKWEKHDITSYFMKISYMAFSPSSGIWKITVKNGKVMNTQFESNEQVTKNNTEKTGLTMDDLFELAKASYQNSPDALFFMTVQYDDTLGYVTLIQTRVNPAKKGDAPADHTYSYEIIEFSYKGFLPKE